MLLYFLNDTNINYRLTFRHATGSLGLSKRNQTNAGGLFANTCWLRGREVYDVWGQVNHDKQNR